MREVIEPNAVHPVKVTLALVRPGDGDAPVRVERRRGDHLADVDPVRDAMIGNVPEPKLAVQ